MEVNARTGSTGYQVVVPSKRTPDVYILEEYANVEKPKNTGLDAGIYELNGRLVYLRFNRLQKVALCEGYYAGPDGYLIPYTSETQPAIEAEANALLQTKLAEAKNLHGIEFSFKPAYTIYENYHFVDDVIQQLNENFPAGSVKVIAALSESYTKRPLCFQQFRDEHNDVYAFWGDLGKYDFKTNMISTHADFLIIRDELGYATVNALNVASDGQLKQTFIALNDGYEYSKYYYYSGNEELFNSFYGGFSKYVFNNYAATSFTEDFSSIFGTAITTSNDELVDRVNNGTMTMPIFNKILYVKQVFNQYAGSTVLP